MARVLRWLAICAFAAMPLALVLGRPHRFGCEPPVTGICDQRIINQSWTMPTALACIALGILLLLLAAVGSREDSDE